MRDREEAMGTMLTITTWRRETIEVDVDSIAGHDDAQTYATPFGAVTLRPVGRCGDIAYYAAIAPDASATVMKAVVFPNQDPADHAATAAATWAKVRLNQIDHTARQAAAKAAGVTQLFRRGDPVHGGLTFSEGTVVDPHPDKDPHLVGVRFNGEKRITYMTSEMLRHGPAAEDPEYDPEKVQATYRRICRSGSPPRQARGYRGTVRPHLDGLP